MIKNIRETGKAGYLARMIFSFSLLIEFENLRIIVADIKTAGKLSSVQRSLPLKRSATGEEMKVKGRLLH